MAAPVETSQCMFKHIEPTDLSAVSPARQGDILSAVDRLSSILASAFPYTDELQIPMWIKDKSQRPAEILKRLMGTSRTRIGPEPNDSAKQGLLTPLTRAVECGLPVQLVTVWGTSRDPKKPGINVAELADFSALTMLQAAVERIRTVHPPGAVVRIFEEDATCAWLDTTNREDQKESAAVWTEMDRYWNTKTQLFHVMTLSSGKGAPFEFVRESELLKRMGISIAEYHAGCADLEPIFYRYLKESDDIMGKFIESHFYTDWSEAHDTLGNDDYLALWSQCEARLTKLDSYIALKRTGWVGSITPEMRMFYAKRHSKMDASLIENYDKRIQTMAHYFSSTCAKATLGTLNFGLPHPETTVKIPLTLVPNGRPPQFNQLVLLRSIPKGIKGIDAECVAPWLGTTYYSTSDDKLHLHSLFTQEEHGQNIPVYIKLQNTPVKVGIHNMDYPIPTTIRIA